MTGGLFRRNPGLARLIAVQVPADLADWLAFVAIAGLLAYEWQAPPLAFACLGLALGLPPVLIGPAAVALVDRWPLAAVLFWSNLGRGVVTLACLWAWNWPLLVACVAAGACADAFFSPARQAALHRLVAPDDRIAANGLSQAINQMSKIAGPALGNGLLALTGAGPVFGLTAAASALAAALVPGLPPGLRDRADTAVAGLWAGIGAGLALVRDSRMLRGAMILTVAGYLSIFLYDTLIAPLLRDFGLGPRVLGLAIAANGLGGVTGALAGAALMRRGHPFLWVAAALAAGALGTGSIGLLALAGATPPGAAVIAVFAALGLIGAGSVVPLRTAIQSATPPGAMGRVAALTEAAATCALLVAPLAGAALASLGGTGLPFVAGAGLALVFAALAVLLARGRP